MSRILYFDCFSGISGDMALGAMLDAGLPLEDLKGALGSLAVSGFDVSAERVLRAGVSSTKFVVLNIQHLSTAWHHSRRVAPSTRETITLTDTCSAIFKLIDQSALSAAGRDRAKAHVSTAGRGRGRHPPDAGGEGSPARGRRARFDHRHRRHRVRPRVGGRRPHRVLAAQRGRGHGAFGAWTVSRARAGDGEAARRRSGLWGNRAEGARDADGRADRRRRTPSRSVRFPR